MKIQSEIKQEIDSDPGFIVGFADIEGLPDENKDRKSGLSQQKVIK